jgi:hypothetical protein
MQADSSLEESKTVSEPPKSRPDYTLAVRRRELRFKNHHPDPRTSRYGQRLVEEILGCRMSGWLTPKLECNKKLQAIPPPELIPGLKPVKTKSRNCLSETAGKLVCDTDLHFLSSNQANSTLTRKILSLGKHVAITFKRNHGSISSFDYNTFV